MQENVGRHKVAIRPPSRPGGKFIRRGSPDVKLFVEVNNQRVEKVQVTRQKTMVGKKSFYKTALPSAEDEKVARYRSEFKKGQKHKPVDNTDDGDKDNKKGKESKDGGN
ncbi:MAG: hypothetical protein AAB305_03870 [Candidatus Zixiibacteriota bacterium]